jgi:hypothetical protein
LRGFAGREQPVSFIIDEVTQLLGFGSKEQSVMAADIEELVSVIARNYGIYLTIAHQNLPQLGSERIQKALMTMGTQMIGVQTDPSASQLLAEYLYRYDPYDVKRLEPVWMSDPLGVPYVVDYRPSEFTTEEQVLLNSHQFMDLGRFQFLIRAPQQEGDLRASLRKVSIARFDRGLYPNQELVDRACELLMRRSGRPIDEVLAEIEARQKVSVSTTNPSRPHRRRIPKLWGN